MSATTELFYVAMSDELKGGLFEEFHDYIEDPYENGVAGASWLCPDPYGGVRLHPRPSRNWTDGENAHRFVPLGVTVPLSQEELDPFRASDGSYWLKAKFLNQKATTRRLEMWET